MEDYSLGTIEGKFADIIWQEEPVPMSGLVKRCEKELGWKRTTTYTVLKRLSVKGLFKNEDGIVTSLISRPDFYSKQSEIFIESSFEGSLSRFLAAFIRRNKLTLAEVEEIKEIIGAGGSDNLLLESKGVRLDVYLNDDKGTVYNVEMQGSVSKELPKRSRYYQGSIDMDLIAAGELYNKLRKSYVIFICTFDPFHEGRHIYTFENICRENLSLSLGDETTKIFLNTKGKLDDIGEDMKEFLAYIENTTDSFVEQAVSPLIKEIHKKVIEVKQSKEMEVEYMTLLQRDRENIELGREEGLEQSIKILKLYHSGKSIMDIADNLSLDKEYVQRVIDKYEKL